MFDWYSAYLVTQARQQDLAASMEFRRRLAEARATVRLRRGRGRRSGSPRKGASLPQRLGAETSPGC